MILNILTENYMIFVWFAVIIVAFFIEIETMDLSSIWFSAGAFVALIVSVFTDNIWVQIIIFMVVSTLLLLSLRPIFKKYMNRNEIRTNASALIDQEAICIKPIIDNERGEVKIQGKIWTAISNENIYENERVIVLAISGVKLVVKRKK